MGIRYPQALRFQQRVRVRARIDEWENRLRIKYVIEDVETGQRLTKAYTDQVAMDMQSGELMLASPDVLLRKIGVER